MEEIDRTTLRKVILMRKSGCEAKDIGMAFGISFSIVSDIIRRNKVEKGDPRSADEILGRIPFSPDTKETRLWDLEEVNPGKSYKEYLRDEYYRRHPEKRGVK